MVGMAGRANGVSSSSDLSVSERMARDLAWALDPARFAAEALGLTPDGWQARVLRWTGRRLILNCSRQSGKSTITSVLALHQALYQPNSLALLVSPSLRQSSELFRKVMGHLAALEAATGARPRLIEENRLSLQLENGSRVVTLPSSEETVRGFSAVDLVIEDEASRVPDDLYRAVRPMLAVSNGRLVLMSTPFGKRGHFWDTWDAGGAPWEQIKITANDCPRISPAFLAEERRAIGELWFRSEYLCEFVDPVNAVFSSETVLGAFSDAVTPLFGAGAPSAPGGDQASPAIAPLFPVFPESPGQPGQPGRQTERTEQKGGYAL